LDYAHGLPLDIQNMLGNQSLIFSHAKSLLDYPCGSWYQLSELLPKHRVVQVAEKLLIEVFAL